MQTKNNNDNIAMSWEQIASTIMLTVKAWSYFHVNIKEAMMGKSCP